MRRLCACLLGAAAMLASSIACAAETDLAYGAFQAGHYRRAQEEALKRIEANPQDGAAMTLLAEIYRQGLGVAEDQKAATEWYQRAAERGDVNGIYGLAVALLDPKSPVHNAARGGELMMKAAEAGHPAASYNVAVTLLATGRDEDGKRAVALLQRAASGGIGEAMHALGVLSSEGRYVARDPAEAARWMKQASEVGNVAGEVEYAIMLFNGDGVAADEDAAAQLFLRAATKGNPIAQNRLAKLYQSGRGIGKDSAEAAAWHLAARAQGLGDPGLDQLYDGLNAEQKARVAQLAADRIEGAALTGPSQSAPAGQPSSAGQAAPGQQAK